MRELKFRVWDKKNKEWLGESDPNALTYYGFHLFGEATLMQRVPIERLQDLAIMQFTGLVDRLGKDIYEGDIVNFENLLRNPYVVVWSDILMGWSIEKDGLSSLMSLYNSKNTFEVIGNVYENPEKLKEAK